jgi:uncharacterized OsmC-like protein
MDAPHTHGSEAIREAVERVAKAVSLRASIGQGTASTRVRLRPGLSCTVDEGPWHFDVGMSEKYGGTNDAPNPGVYGRAAVGSCLAIGYGIWAARMGVPIDSLAVEIQADYDVRGELGVGDEVSPGYLAMRYIVTIESSAPEADILLMLDTADRHSSWRDDIARAVPISREVRVLAAKR